MTRNEAIEQGLLKYFTGKPCKHGHLCERWVSNYTCVECTPSINARSFQKNKTKRMAHAIKYIKAHPEQRKKTSRSYYERNREKLLSNRDKEKDLTRLKQWIKNNPHLVNANTAKRRAQRLKATPSWVDNEQLKVIYQNCPEGYEVDHAIPLRHPLVCGLHVPWNLQYLISEENRKKSNKFEPY